MNPDDNRTLNNKQMLLFPNLYLGLIVVDKGVRQSFLYSMRDLSLYCQPYTLEISFLSLIPFYQLLHPQSKTESITLFPLK
jgi:hypothetical protein